VQAKSKESTIGQEKKHLSHQTQAIQHLKNKFQKMKFSALMLWKNILKTKRKNKEILNPLPLHKIQGKKHLNHKKISVKAQINTLMMILIQYQEARAK